MKRGRTKMATPAGTFTVVKTERVVADGSRVVVWATNEVPLFRFARASLSDGRELLVVRVARNEPSMFPANAPIRPWPYGDEASGASLLDAFVGPGAAKALQELEARAKKRAPPSSVDGGR